MANDVIHISAEAHAEVKKFCKSANLVMGEWASRVLTKAAVDRVMPPRPLDREEIAAADEAAADAYLNPPFWKQA